MHGSKLKAIWLDCVSCCNKDAKPGDEKQLFVGGGSGAPGMLMREAGLDNVFGNKEGNWVCVNESDVRAADADVMIVVDAFWDTALDKVTWLYNHSGFCAMDIVKGARFVQIPFSASTLSPRNGPAALDLAIAALHVRLGSMTAVKKSGVSSFNPQQFHEHTKGLKCNLEKEKVKYDIITDEPSPTTSTEPSTSTAASPVEVTGSMSVTTDGAVTKEQMQTAAKATVASWYGVSLSSVTDVVATKSRRLAEKARRLADAWSITFKITAPASQAASLRSKTATFADNKAYVKSKLGTKLADADADVKSLTVSSITATEVKITTTQPPATETSDTPKTVMCFGFLLLGSWLMLSLQ